MEPTTYTYSKFLGWMSVLLFGGAILIMSYVSLTDSDPKTWLYLVLPASLCSAFLAYGLIRVLLPALRRDIAIELDNDKFQCNIIHVAIYWKDVFEISEYYSRNYTAVMVSMLDGSSPYKIPTKTIAGSTIAICKKMQEYFDRKRALLGRTLGAIPA
jgi:hypothetical protein